jgi:hypothetical protein
MRRRKDKERQRNKKKREVRRIENQVENKFFHLLNWAPRREDSWWS